MTRATIVHLWLGFCLACSQGGAPSAPEPPMPPEPSPPSSELSLRRIKDLPMVAANTLALGVGFSPDQRYLVVTGPAFMIYDAATYVEVGGAFLSNAGSFAFNRTGEMAVVGGQSAVGFAVPDVLTEFFLPLTARWVEVDPNGEDYFILTVTSPFESDRPVGMVRISQDGEIRAIRDLPYLSHFAVSPDGSRLFVLQTFPTARLLILDPIGLAILDSIPLPLIPRVIVPLNAADQVAILGHEPGRYLVGPLLDTVVDVSTRTIGGPMRLTQVPSTLEFGYGSAYARLGTRAALVSTSHGLIAIDLESGVGSNVRLEAQGRKPGCCEIAFDDRRQRLVFGTSFSPTSPAEGIVEIYEVIGFTLPGERSGR